MCENIKVSIVVPIYNGEKYLRECLNTIVEQTYKNLEIILVSDGSFDNSLNICREYEEKDERIVVIDKENGGVTSARKAGVNVATGDYIFFVDCDDWIESDMVEQLMSEVYENQADVVLAGYTNESGEDERYVMFGNLEEGFYEGIAKKNLNKKMFYQGAAEGWGVWPTVWAKLFKKNLIAASLENLDEKIFYGEDTASILPACLLAERMSVTRNAGYHYRIISTTSVSTKRNKRLLDNMYDLYEYLHTFFQTQEECEIFETQLGYYMVSLMNHAGKLLFDIPYNLQEIEWIKPQLEKVQKQYHDMEMQYYDMRGQYRFYSEEVEKEQALRKEIEQQYYDIRGQYTYYHEEYTKIQGLYNNLRQDLDMGLYQSMWSFPIYEIGDAKRVIIYGAGEVGFSYYRQIKNSKELSIIAWMDCCSDELNGICDAKDISKYQYDCIVLAIESLDEALRVTNELIAAGAEEEKIVYCKPRKVEAFCRVQADW